MNEDLIFFLFCENEIKKNRRGGGGVCWVGGSVSGGPGG